MIGNVKFGGLSAGEVAEVYTPLAQSPWPGGVLAVRTALEPERMANAVRAAVQRLDRDMPVTNVRTMPQVAAESVARPRMRTWIVGVFAAVALLLAAIGIYGVMSYTVEQSMHDLGLRVALGATPAGLLRMTLRNSLVLSGIGVAVGLAGSFALTRAMRSLLYNVQPADPLTFVAVAAILVAVSLLAAWVPARRAAAVDPIVALRWE